MAVKILVTLLIAGVLCGAALFSAVCLCAKKKRGATGCADCIIVLGAKVHPDGRLSNSLRLRCEKGMELWRQGTAESIITCGAQGREEPAPEGEIMRAYFLDKGVPAERVIAENRSVNTMQNLKNAAVIMREKGWSSAVVVTNDYHMERAMWLSKDAKIRAAAAAAPSPDSFSTWLAGRSRECVSWVVYCLRRLKK